MRHQPERQTALLVILIFFFLSLTSCAPGTPTQEKLDKLIAETPFIDVHAHPIAGHIEYEEKDPYPTLEPPIDRPFWAMEKDRIAVFDFLQVQALKEIYGYKKKDVKEKNLDQLVKLSQKFWEKGPKQGFNRVLDICGIEKVFANRSNPSKDLDSERVLWVPFVDSFFYPFPGSQLKTIHPELRNSLTGYSRSVWKFSEKYEIKIEDLSSYLHLIDTTLRDYKSNNAVALKVASGYIRTLWFDDPEKEEVASIFEEGLKGSLSSWEEYKKLQDFIARHIFLKAGELKLPVHFHTGFGASAGLKNLDSNPLNLESIFSDIRFKDTDFLMLHAGYPFWDKLKPLLEKRNIYVDFSAVNWFVFEEELEEILYEWLIYPGASDKIMFGSDGGAPIFFWIAAENSRKALYRALKRLIDKGIISEKKAIMIAEKIIRNNAIRVHNLN